MSKTAPLAGCSGKRHFIGVVKNDNAPVKSRLPWTPRC